MFHMKHYSMCAHNLFIVSRETLSELSKFHMKHFLSYFLVRYYRRIHKICEKL